LFEGDDGGWCRGHDGVLFVIYLNKPLA
jgi:hypothetical protein